MRHSSCLIAVFVAGIMFAHGWAVEKDNKPNIVILFADDLGYGDLGCFGHPTIRTPHLDRMASEGMKFTQFYSAAPVCTPSRAALLTGRLPIRNGMFGTVNRVLFPNSRGGLPDEEVTLAELLREQGYQNACIGKWHLGHLPQYLPTRHGFHYYFGLPYSNDMQNKQRGDPPLPLMRNEEIVEQPAVQATLTRRYTEEAIRFILEHKEGPFFVYLAYTFPHVPLHASEDFRGRSRRGLYGDVVEEIDASVGAILDTLRQEGLSERTFVFFTSDNGPWLIQRLNGGSAGLLRDGKGSTFEGGMRVPGIAWWPSRIAPGSVCYDLACTLDLFVTACSLAGAPIPTDRIIDGVDMTPLLEGRPGHRDSMFYYRGSRLMAVRKGPFKAHFFTQPAYGPDSNKLQAHAPPLLYHLEHDPSEQFDVAKNHPEVIAAIEQLVAEHAKTLEPVPSQLDLPPLSQQESKSQENSKQ